MDDAVMTETEQHHETEGISSSQLLVAAGRLESQLDSRYGDPLHSAIGESVAWSIDNLLAVVSSTTEIKLVHLSLPNQSQTLSIQEKPYLIRFSPEGDLLFAAFESTQTCCVWVKVHALNQWTLRQTWTTWQGKVLDLQWFNEPRKWCPKTRKRRPSKGPQFASGNAQKEAGGLVVCDGGQIILFHGRTIGTSLWQVQMCKVPIPTHKKLAKAALGLVPDEASALFAYTLRMSSKAAPRTSSAEGDALGMFFEGANDIAAMQGRQSETYDSEDGQDKIELAEIRIDLASSAISLYLRRLSPIFTASYETLSPSTSGSLTSLIWLEAENQEKSEGSIARLRLFASFCEHGFTTLCIWAAHREVAEILSEAFYKLETAKVKSSQEEKEDWAIRFSQSQQVSNQRLSHYQLVTVQDKVVCVSKIAANATTLMEVGKMKVEYKIINLSPLEIEGKQSVSLRTDCRLAFSPSGTLIAQVVNGKVKIIEASKSLRWSQDDALIYLPSVYTKNDLTDVARVCQASFESIRRPCYIDETSYQHFARMMEIRAQMGTKAGSISHANSSRLILELLYAYKYLTRAGKGGQFDTRQLWTILAHLEWIVELVEILSRQAYLTHATSTMSSPAAQSTKVEDGLDAKTETNVLALVTHKLPRMILVQIIVLLVRFCNWVHRVNQSKEEAKKLLLINNNKEKGKGSNDAEDPQSLLWSLADNLRLAQMQIDEIFFKSAVDISQAGRFLKRFRGKEAQDEKPRWWADYDSGDVLTLAKEMIESQCIHAALSLFCPEIDSREESSLERDILTKVKLDRKLPHSLCLGCTAKTQLQLQVDERCICGSANWWRIN